MKWTIEWNPLWHNFWMFQWLHVSARFRLAPAPDNWQAWIAVVAGIITVVLGLTILAQWTARKYRGEALFDGWNE